MNKRNYWHRQYVKQLEEKLHSGEPYIFGDKLIAYILSGLCLILCLFTFQRIHTKIKNEITTSYFKLTSDKLLKIVFFDVTQGDGILITLPNEKSFLIDTGPGRGMVVQESEPGTLITEIDAGQEVIVPYLERYKINLDGIVITHPHTDHFGGTRSILEAGFVPKWFMDAKLETSHPEYLSLLNTIYRMKINYKIAKSQQKIQLDPEVDIEILGPIQRYRSETVDRADNNSSIVIKLTYRNFSVLFTADIETFAEMDLLEYRDKLKSTILKVPHHGSFTSTSEPFLDHVSPEVAIISCGRGNPFGHPHQVTLEKLNQRGIKIYRTDQNGNITVFSDGLTYSVHTEREY
ncbi:MAG: MBL fold metallo-hydrolase [Endomicrobia bacterium]|nr:MBL fold metallo-hydrolase [Endomicrobiia bacterium]